MTTESVRYDAVVIGARCAGASTGMLLARRGLRVLIADGGLYGTDTLSTHALMRGAVLQLHRWGLLDKLVDAGTPAVRTTRFYYGDEAIDVQIKPADGVEALYAPRRTLLDRVLVDAARSSGAEVVYQTRLVDLIRSSDNCVRGAVLQDAHGRRHEIRAGIVIGADGMKSSLARLVGAEVSRKGRYSTATVFGYWSGLEIEGYHWHYRQGVAAGTIPTNDGLTIVFAAVPAERFREEIAADVSNGYYRLLAECASDLALSVKRMGRREGNLRGFLGQPGFLRKPWGPGWALVGDAAYFRDPLIAHGITDALRDAEFLARAVAEGTGAALNGYQAIRDELCLNLFQTSDEVASFQWSLEELKEKHFRMSKEMKREVKALVELHGRAETLSLS
jgi:flavin-dependent dehydrogenase